MSKPTLDDIINNHSRGKEWYELLYDKTGGCTCSLGHPPCGFCVEYDWDIDPLDLL